MIVADVVHAPPLPASLDFWRGVYRVADPKITLASVASLAVGTGAAAHDGPLACGWLALTVLGIFFLEAAKNASGELYDFDSGTDLAVADEDRSPFSGGKRVLVDGLLTRRQCAWVAFAFYALGGAAGVAIAIWREPQVLWLGLVGAALAFFYHAPPLKLSYRGLGELAVALSYGPLIAAGAYLVQRHTLSAATLLPTIPLALFMFSFLLLNEFPDARADAGAHKRTLVVRLGRPRAARLFAAAITLALALTLLLPLVTPTPRLLWLALVAALPAAAATRRLLAAPEVTARIIPAQSLTLLATLLYALAATVALFAT